MQQSVQERRWEARPFRAGLIRALVFVAPIAASLVYVYVASHVVPKPASRPLFVAWWIGLSATATLVVLAIDRYSRRLLPLVALFNLSLLFPDRAPSRFRTAMKTGTVKTMEQRLAALRSGAVAETPAEAAEQLLALVAAIDAHDAITRGHSERVRAYTRMIGQELKLSERDLDLLNWAALLHDVGKLKVPYEILNKPGKPTDDEWLTLRMHPVYGAEFVEPLREWLGEWTTAVTQHHERWDGKGYPAGLAGEEIAFPGRIVAVADVFDVITSARSYKSSSGAADGRAEIARCAGTQFDPQVVRALLNVSLGRLRFAMGPLSWLANAPILGRLPLTPAFSTIATSAAAVVAAAASGLVPGAPHAPSAEPALAAPKPQPAVARPREAPPARHAAPPAKKVAAPQHEPATPPIAAVDRPPELVPDLGTTAEDTSVTVPVLANDSDADGDTLVLVDATAGAAGSVQLDPDGVVFTPPPDYSGMTAFTYAVSDGTLTTHATAQVRVFPVNDPPRALADEGTVVENGVVVVDAAANDSDPDGDPLAVVEAAAPAHGTVAVAEGRIRYEPPRGFVGTAAIGYTVGDGNGGTATAAVTVTVTPVNGQPSFVAGPDQSVGEDAGPQTVAWASQISAGAPWEASQHVTFSARTDDAALFAPGGAPRVEPDGRLTYTPADDANGVATVTVEAHDDGGRANGGTDTSPPQSFSIAIAPVNDPPTFTGGDDVTVSTTAGARQLPGWVRTVSPGPANEAGQTMSFVLVTSDGALFTPSGRPAIGTDGTLRFTPAAGVHGSTTVTVRAVDDGGTAAGGNDTSVERQFTITITGVNTAPAFAAGGNEFAFENAGAQTVPGWATAVSPGPPEDAGQHVSFLVGTTNPALFAPGGAPAVAADGTLTFRSAPDANGTATVTVRAQDDGGTVDGGEDTSQPQSFTITVGAVNSAPSFTGGGAETVAEDSGARTLTGWATAISPGPADEAGQTVGFTVTNDNPTLFAAGGQPAVGANGALTFTPATNANGSATITVRAVDNGGTANGGIDTSPAATATIWVTAVNDAPVAADDAPSTNEDSTGVTFDVLANDTDVDSGTTLFVTAFDATGLDGTLTQGTGGSFTYVPSGSYNGTDTFTYDVSDGTGGTDTATVTITVTSQPDAPAAANDDFVTAQDTPLVEAPPGVLANDADEDGDALTAQTTLVSPPVNGSAALSADGSFTYTPNPGFIGTDTFTYRVDDGTGLTDDGVVTITVLSTPAIPSLLHLQSVGASADWFDMSAPLQPASGGVPDYDADGDPGLTIKHSDGKTTITDPKKWQGWVYPAVAPLVLNGPVTLQLWSTVKGFTLLKDAHPYMYLYDCAAGGTGCVLIASNDVQVNNWNGLLQSWVRHDLAVGSVSRTIAAGRELRLKLLVDKHDLWVAMTAAYPSGLAPTLG